jgi:hypothetical protein
MLFIFGLIWIILREPLLLVHARFWAEEGVIFYSSAFLHDFWGNISTVFVGYYTLFNILIVEFAVLFPLEFGPLVTTLAGLIITLIPVYIIAFTQSVFWDNFIKRLFIILLMITFAPPDVWLNTTNIHCYFGVITFLILLVNYDHCSSAQLWFFRIINPMGILTGPEAMFITPAYLWKAYKERSRENIIQAVITVVFSTIQASIIIYCVLYANNYGRTTSFSLLRFIAMYFADGFGMLLPIGGYDKMVIGIPVAIFVAYTVFKRKDIKEVQYLIIAFLTVSVLTVIGALNMYSAPRYSYLPTCILLIFLLYEVLQFVDITSKIYIVKAWMLIIAFSFNIVYYRSKLLVDTEPVKGPPKWKEEVAHWRKDKSYMPEIRPRGGWRIKLSK